MPALYLRYASVSLRSQMQYRVSFLMQTLGLFVLTTLEFLGLVGLFHRFGQIKGWTLAEIGLLYGMINVAFAIAEMLMRGFDRFGQLVQSGDFDRVLLRPRATSFQIFGQEMQLMRMGRFLQGSVVLIWAVRSLHVVWTLPKVVLLIASILGGSCLFAGLLILQATMCFWTIDSTEIVNCFTYGGMETAQFPISIYRPWFRDVFVFLIPLASINYLPAHFLLNRPETTLHSTAWMQYLSPLIGVVFLLVCLQCWGFGVRRYRSTGS